MSSAGDGMNTPENETTWRGEYYWSATFGYWRIRAADGHIVAEVYDADEAKAILADHARATANDDALAAVADALQAGLDATQAVTSGAATDWYWMAQRRRQAMLEALSRITQSATPAEE